MGDWFQAWVFLIQGFILIKRDETCNELFDRFSKFARFRFILELMLCILVLLCEALHENVRWPVNSPHKRPVTQKMFPFDGVIMTRDYVTGLYDRRSRKCNMGTQSSVFHCQIPHPESSCSITHTLSNWNGFCMVDLIFILRQIFFASSCWWSLCETWQWKGRCDGKCRCYDCDTTHCHHNVTRFEPILWCHTMH